MDFVGLVELCLLVLLDYPHHSPQDIPLVLDQLDSLTQSYYTSLGRVLGKRYDDGLNLLFLHLVPINVSLPLRLIILLVNVRLLLVQLLSSLEGLGFFLGRSLELSERWGLDILFLRLVAFVILLINLRVHSALLIGQVIIILGLLVLDSYIG